MGHQFIGTVFGFAQTGLLIGDVDVIIDVGVVGGEVTAGDTQGDFAALNGQIGNLNHSLFLRVSIKKKKRFQPPAERFCRSH